MHKRPNDVKNFEFNQFHENLSTAIPADFKLMDLDKTTQSLKHQTIIRQERENANLNHFRIDKIVSELRGLTHQEQDDLEKKINLQVEDRVNKIKQEAYLDGIEKGKLLGSEKALNQALEMHQKQIDEMAEIVGGIKAQSEVLLIKNKKEIYLVIKRLIKWLVFKEIQDTSYLEKLLEKLILETNQQNHLILRVSQSIITEMPHVIKKIETKMGTLSNLRIEIDQNQSSAGIILETENGILDGSLEGLFKTIDKMFEGMVADELSSQS